MNCPKCNEELPLLSKVCPCCGTVVERDDIPSAMDLTDAIDQLVIDTRKTAAESKSFTPPVAKALYVAIAALAAGVLAARTGAGIVWILVLALVIVAIVLFVKRGKAPDVSRNKISFDYGADLVNRHYKGNNEMRKFVQDSTVKMSEAVKMVEDGKSKGMKKMIIIAAAELVVLLLLVALIPTGGGAVEEKEPEEYDARVEYFIRKAQPEKAVNEYVMSEYNNEYLGAEQRRTLCESLCRNGYTAQAEEFFRTCCAGYAGDVECATAIVRQYVRTGETDAASAFVESCKGVLRYKSDAAKLIKLL